MFRQLSINVPVDLAAKRGKKCVVHTPTTGMPLALRMRRFTFSRVAQDDGSRSVLHQDKQFCHCSLGKAAPDFAFIIIWKRSSTVFFSLERLVMIAKVFNGPRKMMKKKAIRHRRKGSTKSFEPPNPISEIEGRAGRANAVEDVSSNKRTRWAGFVNY